LIDRYSRPKMSKLWSETTKFNYLLQVELAACEAQTELGVIPAEALEVIKRKAAFDIARIEEIEQEVRHDVIAFLTSVAENVGEEARYIHLGMTSSDVLDTALALRLKEAGGMLLEDLNILHETILNRAREHKYTIQIGRSHGIHAEPITFGLKLAVWLEEIGRHQERMRQAIETISVGKISGAVGTYSTISPQVERLVCAKLDLTPTPISTQIIQRDRHAQFVWTLAVIGSSLDKFATEIRHLQRTDVLEVEEPFAKGQKGSSAMPHKRNPVGCENISGLARILRGNSLAALENIALWHERDISHSSVERVILPDSTILLDYMLARFNTIVKDLIVYPDNMKANMDVFGGVIYSQAVLLKLIEKGFSREDAYKIVQDNAMKAWNTKDGNFKENMRQDQSIQEKVSTEDLESCFEPQRYLKNIDEIFTRLGI
jgi:adenylosuccinate lyase